MVQTLDGARRAVVGAIGMGAVAGALVIGTAPSALAIWVFAAVAVPLFAASLGPEVARVENDEVVSGA